MKGSLDFLERARRGTTIPTDLPIGEHGLTRPRSMDPQVEEVDRAWGLRGPVEGACDRG